MLKQDCIEIITPGRVTIELTQQVQELVRGSGIETGLCNLFIKHTSASLILCENADPSVRSDLETFMQKLVIDGDPMFDHSAEGPDDMPAHIRNVLTENSINIPIANSRCDLGTWQGIYLWEHRHRPHSRKMTITIYGE